MSDRRGEGRPRLALTSGLPLVFPLACQPPPPQGPPLLTPVTESGRASTPRPITVRDTEAEVRVFEGDTLIVAVAVGGDFVPFSPEAAAAIVDASPSVEGRGPGDLAINLDRASEEVGVYPIVLVSYLIACNEYTEGAPVDLVKAYLSYVISEEGQALAAEAAGSAPISADLRSEAQGFIDAIQ